MLTNLKNKMKKYQLRKKYPFLTYAGSLIQQNHGENLLGHGFVLWDLENKQYKHVELKNDYGFFTVNLENGTIKTDLTNIPKNVRLRIKYKNCNPSDLKKCVRDIESISNIVEVSYLREESSDFDRLNSNDNFNIHDVSDVEYQNKLIEEELNSKKFKSDQISKIKDINKEFNSKISTEQFIRNIRWKPISFEFENMFSYGEDNYIDFEKLNNIVGLFAKNADGKSSIFDAISFCIFDKFSRGYKASNVLNIKKEKFKCKFHFKINNVDFFIERKGKSDKNRNVKVDVNFWKIENNKKTILNGEARRNTNDIIREYLGSYEDFILTVLSVQNSKFGSFVDMGQSERKDLICQFVGLNIFDKIYIQANEKFKEINSLLKSSNKSFILSSLENFKHDLNQNHHSQEKLKNEIENLEKQKNKFSENIIALSEKTNSTTNVILDISKSEKEKLNIENEISKLKQTYIGKKNELDVLNKNIKNIKDVDDEEFIERTYNEYKKLCESFNFKKSEIDKLKLIVSNKMETLKNLEKHEYDPNCNFCINNIFVKDAITTKKSLDQDKITANELITEFKKIKSEKENLEYIEERYDILNKNKKQCYQLNQTKLLIENEILKIKDRLLSLKSTLDGIEKQIKDYYDHIETVEKNKKLFEQISSEKNNLKVVEEKLKVKSTEILELNTNKNKLEFNLEKFTSELHDIESLEQSFLLYKEYISLVSRDGIPLKIINSILPELENEVNSILHEIVNFKILISSDNKNITTELCYDQGETWPLEMGSGMEKFLSGLAIRVALIHISNLPRPNIICIDEGWGALDSENIGSVESLFNVLKTKFDFVWVISHLDSMRDMVDSQIEINKINGFSKVSNI